MGSRNIRFRRFFLGYCVLLSTILCLALLGPSFTVVPLRAQMSIQLTNASNETAKNVGFDFQVSDSQNGKRIGFSDAVYSLVQAPINTSIGSRVDGSGFALYLPEWNAGEQIRFLIENITVAPDFPLDFSSMASNPVYYPIPSEPNKIEFDGVFSVIGKTFVGVQSISSFHQFTCNGTLQPLEKRTQTEEYFVGFFVFLSFLALLIALAIWRPKMWRRLPFATVLLVLLMIFIYTFIGSGREINAMSPFSWDFFKTWPLGVFMHTSDDHIFGNLAIFIPLSLLIETWINVKSDRRKFAVWYLLPILFAMAIPAIGFSIANEFLAWALWSIIIVEKKTQKRSDLFLCLISGIMAYTFFGWLFEYLPYAFSPVALSWWGMEAQFHIFWGLVGGVAFGLITLLFSKREVISVIFEDQEPPSSKTKKQIDQEFSPSQLARMQQLTSELSSRENSTLVFSTVAASASLAILVLTLESMNKEWFSLAFWMGFLFSLAGFLYREATIFGIDTENYNELKDLLSSSYDTSRRVRRLNFLRMVTIRLFLLIPAGNWILVALHIETAGWMALTYLALFGVAFYLSIRENELRLRR
jgi:hypothetical protein